MLQAVTDKVPKIYKFCYLSYQQSSILHFNRFKLLSNESPQQGDPLGFLLLILTIHLLLTPTTSDLTIGFMDYVILGGRADTVARDVEMFKTKYMEMVIPWNFQKCELISVNCNHPIATPLKDFVHMKPTNFCLLDAPTSRQRHGQRLRSTL